MTEQQIVKKRSKEFEAAKRKYCELFFAAKQADFLARGVSDFGEHKGKALGFTSQQILDAKLPMPFGCPDLFIQPCIDDSNRVTGVIWFCDRVGCICSCCREDMTDPKEAYPTYCPDRSEIGFAYDPEYDNEEPFGDVVE